MRLDGVDQQSIACPLQSGELGQVLSGAARAWVSVDVVGQRHDVARAA